MEEIISAIATPHGKGGVAIIRVSGEGALSLASKMFTPSGKTPVENFEPYRMYPGQIDGGTFTDYGLCVYFKGPKSYTGEDIIEFHCHGGENVARGILKRSFALGARSATKPPLHSACISFWNPYAEKLSPSRVPPRRPRPRNNSSRYGPAL